MCVCVRFNYITFSLSRDVCHAGGHVGFHVRVKCETTWGILGLWVNGDGSMPPHRTGVARSDVAAGMQLCGGSGRGDGV